MATEINLVNMVNALVGKEVTVDLSRDGFDVHVTGKMEKTITEPPAFSVYADGGSASFTLEEIHSVAVLGGLLAVPTIFLKNNDGENGDS